MKTFSLIKASMSEGMNIFKINTKNNNRVVKIILPIIIVLILMSSLSGYSYELLKLLKPLKMEFVLLTVFVMITSIMTFIEGIYKSGSLLFNAKDDNLLFSLPIKKEAVLLVRVLKFYIFELLFNSIFLLPSIIIYAFHMRPNITFYVISLISILIFPIIPIVLSCIIGSITTYISSKFRTQKIFETILTVIFMVFILYISYGTDLITNIAKNAKSINEFITKIYYPAGAYINLITNVSALKLAEFIIINMLIFILFIYLLGKYFFKINSSAHSVRVKKRLKKYTIKSTNVIVSLIKKDFNKFINSPVFVVNASFGLVLFLIGCGALIIKYDLIMTSILQMSPKIAIYILENGITVLLFAFIGVSSFMTSITSSMISLEGKSFAILKSLPVKPYTIVKSKILMALAIMVPALLLGSIFIFIKFKLSFIHILLILISIVVFPLISSTLGIIINLKYPKMDAKTDTEVVKQSLSSMIAGFAGILLTGLTLFLIYKCLKASMSASIIMLLFIIAFIIIYALLDIYLKKTFDKSFDNITI